MPKRHWLARSLDVIEGAGNRLQSMAILPTFPRKNL
jgi:hypothetical protein